MLASPKLLILPTCTYSESGALRWRLSLQVVSAKSSLPVAVWLILAALKASDATFKWNLERRRCSRIVYDE